MYCIIIIETNMKEQNEKYDIKFSFIKFRFL